MLLQPTRHIVFVDSWLVLGSDGSDGSLRLPGSDAYVYTKQRGCSQGIGASKLTEETSQTAVVGQSDSRLETRKEILPTMLLLLPFCARASILFKNIRKPLTPPIFCSLLVIHGCGTYS